VERGNVTPIGGGGALEEAVDGASCRATITTTSSSLRRRAMARTSLSGLLLDGRDQRRTAVRRRPRWPQA
jgi:hypothetical protein